MAQISGVGGAVNGHASVREWSVTSEADLQAFVSSGAKGGTGRVIGNKDWSGSFSAYGDTPAAFPGDAITFTGSIDGTTGCTGPAVVDQSEITVDIESGAIISHTVQFSSNGALTIGAAVATDTTKPVPPTSIGCKVEFDVTEATPAFTEILNVKSFTITFTAANPSYIDASTAGQTKRVSGGNLDATVAIPINCETDFANIIAVNTRCQLRCFTTSALYWEFRWMVFGEASDIQCDVETGEMVACTLNASMSGWESWNSVDAEGYIKTPASSPVTVWP